MDFTKSLRSQMPTDGTMHTEITPDGDKMPRPVSYEGQHGSERTVKMQWTPDGDLIPETGYTQDGDFHWPSQKISYKI